MLTDLNVITPINIKGKVVLSHQQSYNSIDLRFLITMKIYM